LFGYIICLIFKGGLAMKVLLSCLALLFVCVSCDFFEIPGTAQAAEPIVLYDAATQTPQPASGPNPPAQETPLHAAPSPAEEPPPVSPSTPTPTEAILPALTPSPEDASPDTAYPPPEELNESFNVTGAVINPYPVDFQQDASLDDPSALSNKGLGWYYNRNSDHQPPTAQRVFDIRAYDAHYLGDISRPRIYLTFDEGYENGFTAPILDILRDKNVHAAFFLTRTYIRDNPELTRRMAEEGHVVANHSWRHIAFPTLTDEQIAEELLETANFYRETTGYDMDPFFRPPEGAYSARTLALTQKHGYTTVFWSLTHVDWLVDDQPAMEVTFNRVMNNLHNGAVILLHAVSSSNTEALPYIIDAARANGYEFGSVWDLRGL
jgi:peptidoglycan-N-acetylmuramic acid deacetylase